MIVGTNPFGAEMATHERAALIDFLNTDEGLKVANYLTRAKKLMGDLQTFYGSELDMNLLISSFAEGDDNQVELTRQFLDQYFEVRGAKMPATNLPFSVRRVATAQEAKDNFNQAMHSLSRGSVTKGTIDLTASALSAAGFTVKERQLVMALFSASTITSLAAMVAPAHAAVTSHDIHSTMNSFNSTAYSQSLSDPLKIIIEAEKQSIYEGEYQFSPYLIEKIENSANARQYMTWILDAADKNGLDPVLFGNQLFKESVHFSERVIRGEKDSLAGAKGIAQFIKSTGANYGLHSDADFYDPQKAIYAAARHMSDLTADYDGDQILAMVAYNGGPKAVTSAANQLGKTDITGDEWIYAMKIRHAQFGDKDKSAWHNETLDYVLDTTGKGWDKDYAIWANKLQGDEPLLFVEDIIKGNGALAAIQHAAPSAPS